MPGDSCEKSHNCRKADRDSDFNYIIIANDRSSSIPLSLSSDDTDLWSFGESLIQVKGYADTRMLTEVEVGDLTHGGLVWQGNNKFPSRSDSQ